MEKTQLLLPTHAVPNDLTLFPQYLGHIQCRRFFKFIPHTYLQTAGWVIPRLELCPMQTCLANLLTEISLTFELLLESWPSFHTRLHSLILWTPRSPFPFRSFTSSSANFSPNVSSEPDHIKKIYLSAKRLKKRRANFTFLYLWGKVNLSMVVWTAPRFTLPSLSSSCRSSFKGNNIWTSNLLGKSQKNQLFASRDQQT